MVNQFLYQFKTISIEFSSVCKPIGLNLWSSDVTPSWAETFRERAHQHINVFGIAPEIIYGTASTGTEGSDAMSFVQVEISLGKKARLKPCCLLLGDKIIPCTFSWVRLSQEGWRLSPPLSKRLQRQSKFYAMAGKCEVVLGPQLRAVSPLNSSYLMWNVSSFIWYWKYISGDVLLCLNTRMVAPDNRRPRIREAWLFSSLITRQPLETRLGRLRAFVAKPIPKVMASSAPTNLVTKVSNSLWIAIVPAGL